MSVLIPHYLCLWQHHPNIYFIQCPTLHVYFPYNLVNIIKKQSIKCASVCVCGYSNGARLQQVQVKIIKYNEYTLVLIMWKLHTLCLLYLHATQPWKRMKFCVKKELESCAHPHRCFQFLCLIRAAVVLCGCSELLYMELYALIREVKVLIVPAPRQVQHHRRVSELSIKLTLRMQ